MQWRMLLHTAQLSTLCKDLHDPPRQQSQPSTIRTASMHRCRDLHCLAHMHCTSQVLQLSTRQQHMQYTLSPRSSPHLDIQPHIPADMCSYQCTVSTHCGHRHTDRWHCTACMMMSRLLRTSGRHTACMQSCCHCPGQPGPRRTLCMC